MTFQSNPYSVLLVSSAEKMTQALQRLLPGTDFWPVAVALSAGEARRRLSGDTFDLILINSPLTDDAGLNLAADACASGDAAVLLLVRREVYEQTYYELLPAGVVTLSKPTSGAILSQHLRALCALRERLRLARARVSTVEEKIEEIRLVNRAKWLLIEREALSEPEAHRSLIRQAMEQRITRREMALRILSRYQ